MRVGFARGRCRGVTPSCYTPASRFGGALAGLPIWRVFKALGEAREAITLEGGWDETWKQVMAFREADPKSRYDCDTDALTGSQRRSPAFADAALPATVLDRPCQS